MKTDNRASNLEWCTQRDNIVHGHMSGLNPSRRTVTDETIDMVRAAAARGERTNDIAARLNVPATTVSSIRTGKYRERGAHLPKLPQHRSASK